MDNRFSLRQRCESETASSLDVILLLYDAAVDFIEKAVAAAGRDTQTKQMLICKANNIIVELDEVLNVKDGGEVAKNLKLLYSFMNRQLIDAAESDSTEGLADVAQMLSELRESWQHVNNSLQASAA